MVCKHAALIKAAFNSSTEEKIPKEVAEFLLDQQYIKVDDLVPSLSGVVWKMLEGAGQGLNHSTDFCDLAWFRSVETWATDIDVMEAHGILKYARFRDDITILTAKPFESGEVSSYIQSMKRLALKTGWVLKLEEHGSSVPFLDASVSIEKGRICTQPYIKPNAAFNVPLCPTSGQAPHVHLTWPRARLSNLLKLAADAKGRDLARSTFWSKFDANCIPVLPSLLENSGQAAPVRSRTGTDRQTLWLPLPYHPVWSRKITSTVARLNNEPMQQALYQTAYASSKSKPRPMPYIRIAWKNGGDQHMSLIKKAARHVVKASLSQSETTEGGRERRQAAVVVAIDPVSTAASTADAPASAAESILVDGPGVPIVPVPVANLDASLLPSLSASAPITRRTLKPIRWKFKF